MSQMRCSNPECRSTDIDLNESSAEAVCVRCGTVCEESTIVTAEGTEGYLADRRRDPWGGRPPPPPFFFGVGDTGGKDSPVESIHDAASRGDVEAVRRLLASGASPNSFDPEVDPESPEAYETPILAMCKVRGFTDGRAACLELLRDAGADLEAADGDGMTPLHYAARRGDTKIVSILVDEGVDVDAKARFYRGGQFEGTALHLAARQRANACVKVLLAAGASPHLRDFHGRTPFDDAFGGGYEPRTWPLFLRAGAEIPTNITVPYIVRVRNAGGFKNYAQAHLTRVTKTVESVLGLPTRPARLVVEFWLHAGYY